MKENPDHNIFNSIEKSYKTFFENCLDAIMITSQDGSIHAANQAACKMFGWTEEELVRLGRGGIVEMNPSLIEALNERKETGKFFGELTYIKKDGTKFPVEISSSVFKHYDGREFTTIIARDISKRKKIEEALSESEEHLRLASTAAGLGTYSYEFESGKAHYSDEFLELYGLQPWETLELDSDLVAKALMPEDKSRFLSAMSLANDPKGSGILDIEFRIIHRNGEIRWLKTRGLTVFTGKGNEGKPLHANGVVQDITTRKKEEERINELSERCRLITEYSGLGIGYYDIGGKILLFNEEALKNLGGKSDDYIGKNVIDVFGKEAGENYINRFRQAAESEIPIQFEDNLQLDGTPGWYLSTHTRILNRNGELDGIQVIAENITERKIAEINLRTSEAEYRDLFDNSIIGISQAYPDGTFKRINKAYAEMYGYPDVDTMLKEVANSPKRLYSNLNDRDLVIRSLSEKGNLPPSEFELNRRNGEKFWALVGAKEVRNDEGKLLYRQAEHIDITSMKKLEKERSIQSIYARSLIEASLDPLVTINSEGKITDVNLATEKVTGYKRDKLIGSDFADYFIETEKARDGYNLVFSRGEVKNYPLTIRHKTGRTTDVLYNATVFKNEEGIVQGVFAAARDITIRKKMEVKLRASKRLLEKLNQHLNDIRENERSEIAMNLHDDLGQRLTALFLDVTWIKNRIGVQSAAVTKKFEEMMHEINDTIEGIKELSSFLRPTILYDLGLVPAILSQLKKFENQTGIISDFYFDSEEFNDDEKISLILYRVIQESLTNIVRHSGASAMEVNLKKLGNAIELVVSDNGIGIDIDKINSISSMGLEGIRERVKSAHGEVSIKSEKGSGTTIRVKIPIKKN
jgi:PAS domain S-box-containing protein